MQSISKPQTFFRSHSSMHVSKTFVRYASASRDTMDDKLAVVRRALYPPNMRNKPSPTGSWRPNTMRALWKAIPTKQVHEIIERGYKLYLRHQRQKRQAEIELKFESMRNAMTELAHLDRRLAIEANRQEDPRVKTKEEVELLNSTHGAERTRAEARIEGRLRGLFPRELKLPTDTPSQEGWNHDWKPLATKMKTT